MFERIIFNIDGTLVNSEHAIRTSLRELIREEFNKDVPLERVKIYFGIPLVDNLRLLGFQNPEDLYKKWLKKILCYSSEIQLFPEIASMLKQLKEQNFKLGLITSRQEDLYKDHFNGRFGIDHLFEGCVCSNDTIAHKPDPAPILEYLKKFNANPAKTLYVANSVHDFNSANRAGIEFALALWGNKSRGVPQAKYQFNSTGELLDFVSASGKKLETVSF